MSYLLWDSLFFLFKILYIKHEKRVSIFEKRNSKTMAMEVVETKTNPNGNNEGIPEMILIDPSTVIMPPPEMKSFVTILYDYNVSG